MADAKELLKRMENMRNAASNHRENWERYAPYLAPSRRGIISQWTPGTSQTRNVYDSTTLMCAEYMSNFMAENTINPAQQWMGWEPADPALVDDYDAMAWCEESRDRYLKALNNSSFYSEGVEALLDYGAFGTGFLIQEEAPQTVNRIKSGFRGLFFKAERTGRFHIAEGPDGIVDTAFREFETNVGALVRQFDLASVSDKTRALYAAGKLDDTVKMVHAVVPRPVGEQTSGYAGMPWSSCWIEVDAKHKTHEGGYRQFPAAVPRYSKTPGEVFGRGRGDLAFPDTWTLNQAKRLGLEDLAFKIRPPLFMAHDSVIGTLKLVPGGPTSLNTRGRSIRDVVMPFETGARPDVSNLAEEEIRKSIREVFYVEHILELMRVQKSEMTAFEFAKKLNLLFKLLGPVYGRLQREFLYVITEVGFDVCYHGGLFSPPPPSMLRSGTIRTTFNNPIARAQRAVDAETLALVINDLAPLQQIFGNSVYDGINIDATEKGIRTIRGYPVRWSRSDEEKEAMRNARAQQEQQELQQAAIAQAAESAGKAAPMVKVLNERTQAA